jgi:hypothetical protein
MKRKTENAFTLQNCCAVTVTARSFAPSCYYTLVLFADISGMIPQAREALYPHMTVNGYPLSKIAVA